MGAKFPEKAWRICQKKVPEFQLVSASAIIGKGSGDILAHRQVDRKKVGFGGREGVERPVAGLVRARSGVGGVFGRGKFATSIRKKGNHAVHRGHQREARGPSETSNLQENTNDQGTDFSPVCLRTGNRSRRPTTRRSPSI